MDERDTLLQLIGTIYDAAVDTNAWARLLAELTHACGAHSAIIRVHGLANSDVGYVSSLGYSDQVLAAYRDHFIHVDPYLPVLSASSGRVFTEQCIPQRQLERTEYYNDYMLALDKAHILGGVVATEPSRTVLIGIQRAPDGDAFRPRDIRLMEALFPHLQRTLHIHSKLAAMQTLQHGVEAAFDRLSHGIIVLDNFSRPLFANREAEAVLKERSELSLNAFGLRTHRPAVTEQLNGLISAVTLPGPGAPHPGGMMSIPAIDGGDPVQLMVAPVPMQSEILPFCDQARAMVFLTRPGKNSLSDKALIDLFGLTLAEAKLTIALAEGDSLNEFSKRRGISANTVRTQVKRVFDKTATHSQSELVSRVLTSLAGAVNSLPAEAGNPS